MKSLKSKVNKLKNEPNKNENKLLKGNLIRRTI